MGGTCCKCYKETNTETKVEQQLEQTNAPPMHNMQSIPSSSSPIASTDKNRTTSTTTKNGKLKNGNSTTRQRLIDFYKIYNPQKINDTEAIEEVLRRYNGRETKLFTDLNRKYEVPNTNTNNNTKPNPNNTSGDGPTTTKSDDDCDESSPLNSAKETDTLPPVQQPLNTKQTASESPPDSDIQSHPMLGDNQSESVPINTNNNTTEQQPTITITTSKRKSDLFKISVTKPNKKKKAVGTALFGGDISNKSVKRDSASGNKFGKEIAITFGKPIFSSNQSESVASNRSTSFIVGDLSTPKFGDDGLPKFGDSMKRSNTLTLDSMHKDKLNQRRQSSLAVRRSQNRRNLPIKINKVWKVFAQYIVDKLMEEKEEKRKENELNKITETPEATPEPHSANMEDNNENEDAILDEIINRNKDDKNNKKNKKKSKDKYFEEDENNNRKKGHESMEVLQIDPRLFIDAKSRSSASSGSNMSSASDSSSSLDSSSSSATESSSSEIDVYSIELSHAQFNIVLNNNKIEVSPDMCAALIWLLLCVNDEIDSTTMNLGLESDNFHNNPMKERGFHSKQFKKIHKCKIRYPMIDTLMKRIANSGIITRQDKSLHPKHLTYEKRNYIIWDKIFEHLINGTSFNVEEEYLYGALSEEELSDNNKIISMLSSLNSHWQHRVQLMQYIDDKLNNGSAMEREIFFAQISTNENYENENENNYLYIINGWAIQLTDDRSGVARQAVVALASVLTSILMCAKYPSNIFNLELIINPIYNGIFTLVKNRRLKDMADDAYESLIQITDIFAELATSLNEENDAYENYMQMIVKILEEHSNAKIEKHERAREPCIGATGFLLYGIQPEPVIEETNNTLKIITHHAVESTPIGALSSSDIDEKEKEKDKSPQPKSAGTTLSKTMQRKYLLENEKFVISLGNILRNGVTDKSESARKKSFQLLQTLENENNGILLDNLLQKWDFTIQKKYKNWKKLNERKKNSSIKNRKKNKKKNSKKAKNRNLKLKNQVNKNRNSKSKSNPTTPNTPNND